MADPIRTDNFEELFGAEDTLLERARERVAAGKERRAKPRVGDPVEFKGTAHPSIMDSIKATVETTGFVSAFKRFIEEPDIDSTTDPLFNVSTFIDADPELKSEVQGELKRVKNFDDSVLLSQLAGVNNAAEARHVVQQYHKMQKLREVAAANGLGVEFLGGALAVLPEILATGGLSAGYAALRGGVSATALATAGRTAAAGVVEGVTERLAQGVTDPFVTKGEVAIAGVAGGALGGAIGGAIGAISNRGGRYLTEANIENTRVVRQQERQLSRDTEDTLDDIVGATEEFQEAVPSDVATSRADLLRRTERLKKRLSQPKFGEKEAFIRLGLDQHTVGNQRANPDFIAVVEEQRAIAREQLEDLKEQLANLGEDTGDTFTPRTTEVDVPEFTRRMEALLRGDVEPRGKLESLFLKLARDEKEFSDRILAAADGSNETNRLVTDATRPARTKAAREAAERQFKEELASLNEWVSALRAALKRAKASGNRGRNARIKKAEASLKEAIKNRDKHSRAKSRIIEKDTLPKSEPTATGTAGAIAAERAAARKLFAEEYKRLTNKELPRELRPIDARGSNFNRVWIDGPVGFDVITRGRDSKKLIPYDVVLEQVQDKRYIVTEDHKVIDAGLAYNELSDQRPPPLQGVPSQIEEFRGAAIESNLPTALPADGAGSIITKKIGRARLAGVIRNPKVVITDIGVEATKTQQSGLIEAFDVLSRVAHLTVATTENVAGRAGRRPSVEAIHRRAQNKTEAVKSGIEGDHNSALQSLFPNLIERRKASGFQIAGVGGVLTKTKYAHMADLTAKANDQGITDPAVWLPEEVLRALNGEQISDLVTHLRKTAARVNRYYLEMGKLNTELKLIAPEDVHLVYRPQEWDWKAIEADPERARIALLQVFDGDEKATANMMKNVLSSQEQQFDGTDFIPTSSRFQLRTIDLKHFEFDPEIQRLLKQDPFEAFDRYLQSTGKQMAFRAAFFDQYQSMFKVGGSLKDDVEFIRADLVKALESSKKTDLPKMVAPGKPRFSRPQRLDLTKPREGDDKLFATGGPKSELSKKQIEEILTLFDNVREQQIGGPISSGWANDVAGIANNVSASMNLGGQVVASVGDIVTTLLSGGPGSFGNGLRLTWRNGSVKSAIKELDDLGEGETAMVLQGFNTVSYSRFNNISDVDIREASGSGSWADTWRRRTQNVAVIEAVANASVMWNKFWRGGLGLDIARQLDNDFANYGKISEARKTWLARIGISKADARDMKILMDNHHRVAVNGKLRVPDSAAWMEKRPDLLGKYRNAIQIAGDEGVLDPSRLDRPFFANTPAGRVIMQFQSYGYAASDRIIRQLIQEQRLHPSSVRPYVFVLMTIIAGMLTDGIKETIKGRGSKWLEDWDDADGAFDNMNSALLRSTLAVGSSQTIIEALSNEFGRVANDRLEDIGVSRVLPQSPTRFTEGQTIAAIAGPTAGTVGTAVTTAKKMMDGDWERTREIVGRRAPVLNTFYIQGLNKLLSDED